MSKQTKIEIWVGLFVLLTIACVAFIALQVSNFSAVKEKPSYQVEALFSNIGGLTVRAPVKVSGVVIGRVADISIDPISYRAKVKMNIYNQYNDLPADSSASILTSGLLGSQYIGIEIGGDDEVLTNGSRVDYTQSALVLENLIGQFMVKLTEGGGDK